MDWWVDIWELKTPKTLEKITCIRTNVIGDSFPMKAGGRGRYDECLIHEPTCVKVPRDGNGGRSHTLAVSGSKM